MGMTLHELTRRMSSSEFSMHMALAAMDYESANPKPKMDPDFEEWFGDA